MAFYKRIDIKFFYLQNTYNSLINFSAHKITSLYLVASFYRIKRGESNVRESKIKKLQKYYYMSLDMSH